MNKRGQITVFIILGIIIVAVILLVLYGKRLGFTFPNIDILGRGELNVKDEVRTCILDFATPALDILGKQGGSFNPKKFNLYQGYNVNYLCYNQEDTEVCSNRILRLEDLEEEIKNYIQDDIKACIDARFSSLRNENVLIQSRNFDLGVTIARDNILIQVKYPTSITYKDTTTIVEDYLEVIHEPLGRSYEVSYDIVRGESLVGDFDPLPYMLVHKDIEIKKDRPYPDKLYIINKVNDNYFFQFAVEGEQR